MSLNKYGNELKEQLPVLKKKKLKKETVIPLVKTGNRMPKDEASKKIVFYGAKGKRN